MRTKNGFTLIEVLVTATIIAILTSIGVASYQAANKHARDAKRRGDLEQIRSALEMYRSDNNLYPSTGGGNWTNANNLPLSSYLNPIPSPPKTGEAYYYQATDLSGGHYYGYCLSAKMEGSNPADSCPPYTGYNLGLKSP